jgi:hypothetical protein
MRNLKEMEEFIKTNKIIWDIPNKIYTNEDLSPYAYQEIVIKVEDKLYKRLLQWDEINKRFFVEYDKHTYEVTKDLRELPDIFTLTNQIR